MRIYVGLTAMALALVLVSCGGSQAGSTPEATFESFQSSLRSKDYEGLANLMPPKQREQMQKQFEELQKNPDAPQTQMMLNGLGISKEDFQSLDGPEEFLGLMVEKMIEKDSSEVDGLMEAEVTDTKIDGEKARLTVKSGDFEKTIILRQVDGLWYIEEM